MQPRSLAIETALYHGMAWHTIQNKRPEKPCPSHSLARRRENVSADQRTQSTTPIAEPHDRGTSLSRISKSSKLAQGSSTAKRNRALMSSIQTNLESASQRYSSSFTQGHLALPPAKKYLVLTCMDARIDPAAAFGIVLGDAHVIRNVRQYLSLSLPNLGPRFSFIGLSRSLRVTCSKRGLGPPLR
jgi:hypothetical protein